MAAAAFALEEVVVVEIEEVALLVVPFAFVAVEILALDYSLVAPSWEAHSASY